MPQSWNEIRHSAITYVERWNREPGGSVERDPIDKGFFINFSVGRCIFTNWRSSWFGLVLTSVILACAACRSMHGFPPVDLSSPGWRVQEGQALWKPTRNRPELAGELLVATNACGDFFLQFTKTPFTVATCQRIGDVWCINLGPSNYSRTGKGRPPERFAWFALENVLQRGKPSRPWQFDQTAPNEWRLTNSRTGESLQAYLTP
jgi:hypothetical protein